MSLPSSPVRRASRMLVACLAALLCAVLVTACGDDDKERPAGRLDEQADKAIVAWDINTHVNGLPEGYEVFLELHVDDPEALSTRERAAAYLSRIETSDKEWDRELRTNHYATRDRLEDAESAAGSSGLGGRYWEWRRDQEERALSRPATLVDAYLADLDAADDEQSATDAEIIRAAVEEHPRAPGDGGSSGNTVPTHRSPTPAAGVGPRCVRSARSRGGVSVTPPLARGG